MDMLNVFVIMIVMLDSYISLKTKKTIILMKIADIIIKSLPGTASAMSYIAFGYFLGYENNNELKMDTKEKIIMGSLFTGMGYVYGYTYPISLPIALFALYKN